MYDAFISYSTKDREWVENLVRDLENKGADTWVDFRKIKGGHYIPEKINEGLAKSNYILFVMTPAGMESNWGKIEIGYDLMSSAKKLIPLLVLDCIIPPLLTGFPVFFLIYFNLIVSVS
jgi:hypothetical protein